MVEQLSYGIPKTLRGTLFLHTAHNTQTWDLLLSIKRPGMSLFEHRSNLVKLDSDAAVSGPHGHQNEHMRQQREWSYTMEARKQAVGRGVGPLPAQGKKDNNSVSRLWAKELASTRMYTAQLSSSVHSTRSQSFNTCSASSADLLRNQLKERNSAAQFVIAENRTHPGI